ncbi:MAG: metallophosphoesterase [Myxococcales bacterium]|nr:metallophosphoesterase [Myxococcales bacterium]
MVQRAVFAVGDVHGCAEELRALLQKLPLTRDSLIVFLGDYIDRGPSSRGVIETILDLQDYCEVKCLLGNHELMLREFLDGSDPRRSARFVLNGGGATLASYANDDGLFVIPPEHLAFYEGLPHHHVEGDFCFVHAGLPVDLPEIDVAIHGEEMVWMRQRRGFQGPKYSKTVVHGHTPVSEVEITDGRINIDTSCVYGIRLTAMEVHTQELWTVERSTAPKPIYLHDSRDSRRRAFRFTGKVPVAVRHEGKTLAFETLNYSEIGLLMVPADGRPDGIGVGTAITGVIGSGEAATPFRGVVLRIDDGDRYAVKLIADPVTPP